MNIITNIKLKKLPHFRGSFSKIYFVNFVPLHFGQGGKVSVLSSKTTTVPHFVHLYEPFPGFSPVVCIFLKFRRLITSFQLKGLKAYPIISYCLSFCLQKYLEAVNCLNGQYHSLIEVYYGQFPNPFRKSSHKRVCTSYFPIYLFDTSRNSYLEQFVPFPKPALSFSDMSLFKFSNSIIYMINRDKNNLSEKCHGFTYLTL